MSTPNQSRPEFEIVEEQRTQYDPEAIAELFRHFGPRLIQLSDANLAPWLRQRVEPEDIIQTVFRTFLRRYPNPEAKFDDWCDIWRLLARITRCKCAAKARYHRRQRRAVDAEQASTSDDQVQSREPTPEEMVMYHELLAQLLNNVSAERRPVLEAILSGCTMSEAATLAGCSLRTANRVLAQARQFLDAQNAEPPTAD